MSFLVNKLPQEVSNQQSELDFDYLRIAVNNNKFGFILSILSLEIATDEMSDFKLHAILV